MRITQLFIAVSVIGSFTASQAGAQQIVHRIREVQPIVEQASPTDLAVPVSAGIGTPKDDLWQKDGAIGCKDGLDPCGSGGADPFELYPTNSMGVKLGGWTQVGVHSRNSIADGFNQNADGLHLHQQWFYAEREADGSYGLDWGFRFDVMYGIDANNTQAFGNNFGRWDYRDSFQHGEYGWALPQAYLQLAYGDLSVIAGHFYTLIGFEVVPAPKNFFYSHAFTMNWSEPFTHTGALATYDWTDQLTIYAGWTLGWDTGFDQFGSGSNWLGGFSYDFTDSFNFTYISTAGDFGAYAGQRTADYCYEHSLLFTFDITDRLQYLLQADLLDVREWELVPGQDLRTYGINQYLFYELNDRWVAGARVEWWKNNLFNAAGNVAAGQPYVSYNAATFGLNYRPHPNLVLRPEVKHEWVPAEDFEQTIFGIDMVLTY